MKLNESDLRLGIDFFWSVIFRIAKVDDRIMNPVILLAMEW